MKKLGYLKAVATSLSILLAGQMGVTAQFCLNYVPKVCNAGSGPPPGPLPCNFYSSTTCWTRGDCTSGFTSGALWPLTSTSPQSCTYFKTLRVLCVFVYIAQADTCYSDDVDCAPASCEEG